MMKKKTTDCGAETEMGHVCEMEPGHAGNHRYSATPASEAARADLIEAEVAGALTDRPDRPIPAQEA